MSLPDLEVELEFAAPLALACSVGDDDLDRVIVDLVGNAAPAVEEIPQVGAEGEIGKSNAHGKGVSSCIMARSRSLGSQPTAAQHEPAKATPLLPQAKRASPLAEPRQRGRRITVHDAVHLWAGDDLGLGHCKDVRSPESLFSAAGAPGVDRHVRLTRSPRRGLPDVLVPR